MAKRKRATIPVVLLYLAGFLAALSFHLEAYGSLQDGLVAHYPLNGNARDASGNGFDGRVVNAEPAVDRFGNKSGAMHFNGTNSYIDLGTKINIPSWPEYSVSVWFSNDGRGTNDGYGQKIIDKTVLFHDFYLTLNPGANENLKFMTYEGAPNLIVDNSGNYKDGRWHHVVIKKDRTHGELWVNGVLKGTSRDVKTVNSAGNLIIGYSLSKDALQRRYFSGRIDDLRIYRRALSSAEIKELYSGRGRPIIKVQRPESEQKTEGEKEPRRPPVPIGDNISRVPKFASKQRPNDLAIIIGIEKYRSVPPAEFSSGDAKLVKEYMKALGFAERNIELLSDDRATYSDIRKSVETWLPNRVKNDSTVFIYYSGHGAPDPSTGEAYIVPYDGDPGYLKDTGYPLKRLYESVGKLKAREVVVVIDSCFSGAGGRSVLAKGTKPLVMMAETAAISSNVAVLTASQGSQISASSAEKGHGIFTYYFLKSLKAGKRNIAEIYEDIKPQVEDEAKMINVQQTPGLNPPAEKIAGKFILRK